MRGLKVSPEQVSQDEKAKAAKKAASEDAPQQVTPGSNKLAPEIPRHRRQGVLCVANGPVERALQPAVHLLLRRCQCLRQARFDDGTDDGGELLPRFLRVALENSFPGD